MMQKRIYKGSGFSKIFIYEDETFGNFYPLALSRPVFEIPSGIYTPVQRVEKFTGESPGLICRNLFHGELKKKGFDIFKNTGDKDQYSVFINALAVLTTDVLEQIFRDSSGEIVFRNMHGDILGFCCRNVDAKVDEHGIIRQHEILKIQEIAEIDASMIHYPWELLKITFDLIEADYRLFYKNRSGTEINSGDPMIRFIDSESIFCGENCEISPGVVIDARRGPVILEKNTKIYPGSWLEGPLYAGENTEIHGAQLHGGNFLGRWCKIGGEVEASVFLGFTNKVHAGFMGHAVVGEWVNLGAMTTNSDLKNNYGEVRVSTGAGKFNTGMIKFGAVIGDHVKTAIGTLIGTGAVISTGCNIFGAHEPVHGYIPPFVWGIKGMAQEYELDKFFGTAGAVMQRRNIGLTPEYKEMFRRIFDESKQEREYYIKSRNQW